MSGHIEQRLYQEIIEASPCGMIMVNQGGKIVLINKMIELMFGYQREELLSSSIDILVPERFRGHHAQHRHNFFAIPSTEATTTPLEIFNSFFCKGFNAVTVNPVTFLAVMATCFSTLNLSGEFIL